MSWKRHFRVVTPHSNNAVSKNNQQDGSSNAKSAKYSSYLPEIYGGHPNRIQRYYQYEDMDRDSDINAALDMIADFCTQSEEQNDEPFMIHYNEEGNETEVKLLKTYMTKWIKLNDFRSRLWYMFRGCIKNGDQFFLRDPETNEWLWIDHFAVELVKVDDTHGKEPDEYVVRGLDYNKQAKFATKKVDPNQYRTPLGNMLGSNMASRPAVSGSMNNNFQLAGASRDPRMMNMQNGLNEAVVLDAKHVVHLSLSVGMDINWPFGASILEPIFKTYKQKELLEDAIIIYRVQRAPERRIFYIDCGTMPPTKANAHIERIKNEIHQRRIPNRTGGGSSIMDAAYNPLCLALDTKIPLLDGRTMALSSLIDEHQQGKENWVYSCDPVTGKVVPGKITWAGVTRQNAKVLKLHLDNGEIVTCTPDHKVPVLGRGFVEAQNIRVNEDSLISFETRLRAVGRAKNARTYTQVYDHEANDWMFTHRMVGDFFRARSKHQEFTFLPENADKPKVVVHHKDYDRYNNDPRNLTFMNKADHIAYHVFNKRDYWDKMPRHERACIATQISEGLKKHYGSLSESDREKLREMAKHRNQSRFENMRKNEPEKFTEWNKQIIARGRTFRAANPDHMRQLGKMYGKISERVQNQDYCYSQRLLSMFVDMVKDGVTNQKEALALLNANADFIAEIRNVNPPIAGMINKIGYDSMPLKRLQMMLTHFGYKNWKDFVAKIPQYNHKVTRIEWCDETIDVGTITVDGNERWHNFHTFAIASGIFVKNSIMDDYFFAQSAEGRGSKVETLPGGELVGEIGDLQFFSHKMLRGLRIPPTYLQMSGEHENMGASHNDGKLGAAMIQEFRFNKYCMRLQSLLSGVFDKEFKKFLKENGIEIESSLFELQFNPPQNFTKYRQIELDMAQMGVFGQVSEYKRFSERFKMKRFLNLTDEEILENEKLWAEENADKLKRATGQTPAESETDTGLSSVGVRPGGMDMNMPMPDDTLADENPEGNGQSPISGGQSGAGAPSTAPSAPPAGPQ